MILEIIALPFFQRALLVGLILGFTMAVAGVFVVLRKMSFFSDAIGHSALAGIAAALLFNFNPFIGGFAYAMLVALGITAIRHRSRVSLDTLLGVFFSASVAIGVILVSLTPGYQSDLIAFLFGNILTVSRFDVVISIAGSILLLIILGRIGKGLITISVDPALAQAEGIPTHRYELIFLLLLAGIIALAIKLVGVILVTALLIIPAATGQNLARSLTGMFGISITVGIISVLSGLFISAAISVPTGPAIVLSGGAFFLLSVLVRSFREAS